MAEYETVTSFPVVDQARITARNYGRSCLEALSTAFEATTSCLNDSLIRCIPQLRRSYPHDPTYDWEDDTEGRWSDELERLLDSEGQTGEDSTNTLSVILSRLPFVRSGGTMSYKPSAANLRRARNKSRSSIHTNGSGGTAESLRSRADLFDHSGDEFEDAGMLPDERIFALTAGNSDDLPVLLGEQSEAELQEEERLVEQQEEALLQMKRERAQRLAVKRGLSDSLTSSERPRSSGQGGLRDAIPLRRGRSSTLQSQASDSVPLRGRSSTLGSQSSGIPSPRIEHRTPASSIRHHSPRPPSTIPSPLPLQSPTASESEESPEPLAPATVEDSKFSEYVQAEPFRVPEFSIPTSPSQLDAPSAETTDEIPPPTSFLFPNTSPETPTDSPTISTTTPTTPTTQDPEIHSPTPTRPTSPSFTRQKRIIPEKLAVRRSPSKVPGDYDPVTGYYQRKLDADVRVDEEEQVAETWKQSLGYLGKD